MAKSPGVPHAFGCFFLLFFTLVLFLGYVQLNLNAKEPISCLIDSLVIYFSFNILE
jgi:hypothetical protein